MALIPYDPFRHLESIRRDMNRFFTSDFPSLFAHMDEQHWMPRIDMHETANEYVVSCDLPGLERKEDVHIDVQNNMLTISGTIQRHHDVKEEQMHRRERFFGRFQRSITLPADAATETIRATYKNGVLDIHIPKTATGTKKRVDIEFH
ncbi:MULTISPECIES: Hsp20/alpha crystallin family protein [Geobacillus]|uniref:Hsp20/alpha crystallin family protein n=1 Tax=Geobacillus TaxID=129337 RepID=UPI0009C19E5B|nr:Hsp20/alpha crystallin family protein [Geobacillus sp. 46C-IIa]OQP05871.1 heat-shock protein Hsp20 [Geobacillus sp. 46C-IIa]QNU29121.1 Hsp20/alpha crystallin family protein [Geobacillus sp. 46C-IIa]